MRFDVVVLLVLACGGSAVASEFAAVVVEYLPAPGGSVNDGAFNDPSAALGPPVGGGVAEPENSKVVTLGGFGGSITLGFDETVLDDPLNPYGLDAIVFGNAFWAGGDADRKWAEPGVIEVSRDANGNGVADDAWFVIRGSSLPDPPGLAAEVREWDNDAGTATPPGNVGWYPSAVFFPGFPSSYATGGYLLGAGFHPLVVENPNGLGAEAEGHWGYADVSPVLALGDTDGDGVPDDLGVTAEEFFTRPDNPRRVGVDTGSCGGDAFDIAWAVDSGTGEPARLDGFDFLRVSTGVDVIVGVFGEKSAEVGGASDVRADAGHFDVDGSGWLDVEDLYAFHAGGGDDEARDVDGDLSVTGADEAMLRRAVRAGEEGDVAKR